MICNPYCSVAITFRLLGGGRDIATHYDSSTQGEIFLHWADDVILLQISSLLLRKENFICTPRIAVILRMAPASCELYRAVRGTPIASSPHSRLHHFSHFHVLSPTDASLLPACDNLRSLSSTLIFGENCRFSSSIIAKAPTAQNRNFS